MATRSKGPLAGFGWLRKAINLGHGNPKAVFGGAALTLVMALLPSLLTLPLQMGAVEPGGGPDMTRLGAAMAISMLAGLLLVPVFAGFMRVIDAADRGLPARAVDVFGPYRQGETLRLVGYGLAMLLVYAVVFALVVAVAGSGLVDWYMQVLAAQSSGHAPPSALPAGFGLAMGLMAALGLLVMGIYAISLGQVALGGRSVAGAIGDGIVGSLKNVLPLLVFAVCLLVAWIVVSIGFVLLGMLLAFIGALVAPWLVVVLMVPLYVVLMLGVFVVMFGVMYHLWRDVCGDDAATTPAPGDAIAA